MATLIFMTLRVFRLIVWFILYPLLLGGAGAEISQSLPMPLAGFGEELLLVKICGSQQPGVALATTKERGVALATDEMRGYPDINTTGTHLTNPRCPFSDRKLQP